MRRQPRADVERVLHLEIDASSNETFQSRGMYQGLKKWIQA